MNQQPDPRRESGPPAGMAPGGMMPGGMMPGGMTPGGMVPGGMMPGGMVPGGMMPGGMMPGGMVPGGMMQDAHPEGRPMGDVPETAAGLAGLPLPSGDLSGLASRIPAYLQDEVSANAFYRGLAQEAGDETTRRYLEEAAADEQKHFRLLSDLYTRLTGRQAHPAPGPVQYGSLREGLLIAADGEVEAYEEYKDEYQRATDPYLRWLFFQLFSDEIEHAVRFNIALHRLTGEGQGSGHS